MNTEHNFIVNDSEVKTPYYCFCTDFFEQNVQMLKERLQGKAKLCFSLKANPWLIDTAKKCCDFIEVCSPGEFDICLQSGVPLKKLSVGGISKTVNECQKISKYPPHRVSIESFCQLSLLEQVAKSNDIILPVLLRLTSGNQFGMPMEIIKKIYDERADYPHIDVRGIHYYPGTQKKKMEDAYKLISTLTDVSMMPKVKEIQFGAGFGVPLYTKQCEDDFYPYRKYILEGISRLSEHCEIVLECGRFLSYSVGAYVTTVLEVKKQCGKSFIIVDGGIHQLSYYGQIDGHQIPPIIRHGSGNDVLETYTICGSLCTASDILAKNVSLPCVQPGDRLVFFNAGAYSVTESRAMFLCRDLPTIVIKKGAESVIMRKAVKTYPLNSTVI